MSKFFDRLTGTYVETEMVIYTYIERLVSSSTVPYKKCYIQFKRGEVTERSDLTFDIQAGDVETRIGQIFQKQSVFYKKKESKVPEYQPKQMEIRIFGVGANGIPACLGEKSFNVSNYVGKTKLKMELGLENSLFKSKLCIQMTIVTVAESKNITEAFIRDN